MAIISKMHPVGTMKGFKYLIDQSHEGADG